MPLFNCTDCQDTEFISSSIAYDSLLDFPADTTFPFPANTPELHVPCIIDNDSDTIPPLSQIKTFWALCNLIEVTAQV